MTHVVYECVSNCYVPLVAGEKAEPEMKKGFDHSKPSIKIAGAQEGTRALQLSLETRMVARFSCGVISNVPQVYHDCYPCSGAKQSAS